MQTQAVDKPLATPPPILEVQGLKTHFFTRNGIVKAVDGVDPVSYTHLTLPTTPYV